MQDHFAVVIKGIADETTLFEGTDAEVVTWLKAQSDVSGYLIVDAKDGKGLSVKNFLTAFAVVQFVPKFYRMNPETDELLPNGRHLANGMRVLIENSSRRIDVSQDLADWEEERALKNNRWCTVEALEVIDAETSFIGVYDDGSKLMRLHPTFTAWLVKTDSIRSSENMATDRYLNVLELVARAMETVSEVLADDEATNRAKAIKVGKKAEDTTKQILGLL